MHVASCFKQPGGGRKGRGGGRRGRYSTQETKQNDLILYQTIPGLEDPRKDGITNIFFFFHNSYCPIREHKSIILCTDLEYVAADVLNLKVS